MTPTANLIFACTTLALLTFTVAGYMYSVRIREMQQNRIRPQALALSKDRAKLTDTRAADNYNHLFELPVLFYTLCALAVGAQHIPAWLPMAAWAFVALRVLHSIIQCTYNKVMHRFYAFVAGLFLMAIMWIAFTVSFAVT